MFDEEKIRRRIQYVAEDEMELSTEVAKDVAFHMTDWLGDLSAFVEFCQGPEASSDSEIEEMLVAFLTHAPNHLAAAGKLFIDQPVADVFGVGATSESE